MTYSEYLKFDYADLVNAAKKITGNSPLALDLLHTSIVELSGKQNVQEVIDAGAARFYIIKVMMIQWRSVTGPFYRNYVKQGLPIMGDVTDETEATLDEEDLLQIRRLIDELPWYEKTLFHLYAEGEHNYSTLSKLTKIPRTSISLSIRRVRDHVKNNLKK